MCCGTPPPVYIESAPPPPPGSTLTVQLHFQTSEEVLVVRQFQLLTWPNTDSVPPHKTDILDVLGLLQDWQQQNTRTNSSESGKIIIHCLYVLVYEINIYLVIGVFLAIYNLS